MKVRDIIHEIEQFAPLAYQESYDNSGLIIGSMEKDIKKVLLCLDVSDDIIKEAVEKKAGLIIAHHPLIFDSIKNINPLTNQGNVIIEAIKHNLCIYASHTSLDNTNSSINGYLAENIGLKNIRVLVPKEGVLRKLVTFCPADSIDKVRTAVFGAGAGHIGDYDSCSYNVSGQGTFKASEKANPYVGKKNELHFEEEIRFETIYPVHKEKEILSVLFKSHPYEEVAYDIYTLNNHYINSGSGVIGSLEEEMDEFDFIKMIKERLGLKVVKHNNVLNKKIRTVALCSGAGSFLIPQALKKQADVFISSEFKHNHYIDNQGRILIIDIGHYESEQFAKEIIKSVLIKKIPKFAVEISGTEKNPVNYY